MEQRLGESIIEEVIKGKMIQEREIGEMNTCKRE